MRRTRARTRKCANVATLPKYSIGVASDLSGVAQQQLRRMEESGLVSPSRSDGGTRLYSDDDLARIAQVSDLAERGVNAAGIRQILDLQTQLGVMRSERDTARAERDDAVDRAQRAAHQPGPREGTPSAPARRRGQTRRARSTAAEAPAPGTRT
jgi:MerR family transcriptional regulator/heat shock protein HspR